MREAAQGQSWRLPSIIALTVVFLALSGASAAAAEIGLPSQPNAPVLKLPPEVSATRAEKWRDHQPLAARVRKPRKAIVGGHTDYTGALAVLHYFDGSTWQPYLQTYANQFGYYSLRVPAGYLYSFYVSAKVSTTIYFPNIGLVACKQTWADWSNSVKAKKGRVYNYLHTYLQPAQPGCDYPP